MKKRIIMTNSREIYEKLNMLHFSPEVVLKNVKKIHIEKILNTINKNSRVLNIENIGEYFVIKKVNPLNFEIYLRK